MEQAAGTGRQNKQAQKKGQTTETSSRKRKAEQSGGTGRWTGRPKGRPNK